MFFIVHPYISICKFYLSICGVILTFLLFIYFVLTYIFLNKLIYYYLTDARDFVRKFQILKLLNSLDGVSTFCIIPRILTFNKYYKMLHTGAYVNASPTPQQIPNFMALRSSFSNAFTCLLLGNFCLCRK